MSGFIEGEFARSKKYNLAPLSLFRGEESEYVLKRGLSHGLFGFH